MTDTREHIIQTATNLFLQKGFKEVTMKELVDSAGLSKGAFYHYFTSKEQVFEVVVLSFLNATGINDYDVFSTTSLKDFYTNWVKSVFNVKSKINPIGKSNNEFSQNHYYLVFDGLRLVPAFREVFDEEQKKELKAWIKIIDIAKENGEIKSKLPSKDIAKMFMYIVDGLGTSAALQNRTSTMKTDAIKALDNIYTLLQ